MFPVKSLVLDITNNWGYANFIQFRSLELTQDGVVVPIDETDFTAYGNFWGSSLEPKNIFDTGDSKIGTNGGNEWASVAGVVANVRISVVFNSMKMFNGITINNGHTSGSNVTSGAKDIKITASLVPVTSITYNAAVDSSYTVFDGQIAKHVALNVVDNQVLSIDGPNVSPETGDMVLAPEPYTLSGTRYLFAFDLTAPRSLVTIIELYRYMVIEAPVSFLDMGGSTTKIDMDLLAPRASMASYSGAGMVLKPAEYFMEARASSPFTGSFQLSMKRATLRMYTGGGIQITSPEASIVMAVTVPFFGSMEFDGPAWGLSSSGINAGLNAVSLSPGGYTMSGRASLSVQCSIYLKPGSYSLLSTGNPGAMGYVSIFAPAAVLRMGELTVLVCDLELTAPRMECSGRIDNFSTVVLRYSRTEVR